ncbi:hypothetical protein C4J81_04640 [Deltaproteobacteria bacterium Smac51]|nr:hypothetical protein C4J81_01040 [Deltaproteobacteria bacterium Smac51]UQZ88530.1 hypothetical protein C4J81_04640 [Deltaproteobacteria bacterium Smac51]
MKKRLSKYFWNILLGFDRLFNTIVGGYPDETFSARTHRKAVAGQPFWLAVRLLIDKAFFWQTNHCRMAYETEARRGHSPNEFTNGQ